MITIEKEGCGSMDHIRLQPKRVVGNGKFVNLKKCDDESKLSEEKPSENDKDSNEEIEETPSANYNDLNAKSSASFFESAPTCDEKSNEEEKVAEPSETKTQPGNEKKSWAMMVNPSVANSSFSSATKSVKFQVAEGALSTTFGSMNLNNAESMLNSLREQKNDECGGGQFSDADDDDSIDMPENSCYNDESSDDGDEFASIGEDFSDEDCDVYILDPDEVEEKRRKREEKMKASSGISGNEVLKTSGAENNDIMRELEMEFPSLAAASTVPYEGSDDEGEEDKQKAPKITQEEKLKKAAEEEAQRRANSLKPVSKSGKLYNTLGKYKELASAKGIKIVDKSTKNRAVEAPFAFAQSDLPDVSEEKDQKQIQSRVIGGIGMSGQSTEVDDDGEGWVTSTQEIVAMKATGKLDPFREKGNGDDQLLKPLENLPGKKCRTACATTDFAMQNVILQMNLELLTVDGVRVRKLKSWVQRCSTCLTVYTNVDSNRLFCDRCGSSSIQRVAASVDGKTGRLKLHLKKNYQHKLRGTKFALPKPGTQNRFMGDLLLSEDQLMYGALNQRVKQTRSKNVKASQSIFGADIAATVGCVADLNKRGDIKVGFGRKNPNATKFGRERRGKKKKNSDKVCGLRRY